MADAGRPEFKATPALRKKVEQLVACGMSQEDIARVVGCSKPTLAKHFPDELDTGAAKKRAEVIALLFKKAAQGNVAAIKKLLEMNAPPAAPGAPAQGKVGKKEAADIAAATAGQDSAWGDDLTTPLN